MGLIGLIGYICIDLLISRVLTINDADNDDDDDTSDEYVGDVCK